MNQHQAFVLLLAVVMGSMAAPATRADDTGFYVLGSIGRSNIGANNTAVDNYNLSHGFASSFTATNDHDTGYKAQLGYRFGTWAIEGGYTDLGRSGFTSTTDLGTYAGDFRAKLGNLDLVGMFPAGQHFILLAKVGGYYWESTSNMPSPAGGTMSVDDNGWDFKFGAGVQYNFNEHFGLRAEFERFNGVGDSNTSGDSKVNLMSAGAVLKF